MTETCQSCRYFKSEDHSRENCQRHPPVVLNSGTPADGPVCKFPMVRPDVDWCGEYQPQWTGAETNFRLFPSEESKP